MSYKTYNALWKASQQALSKAVSKDRDIQRAFYEERIDLVKKLRHLYVQYLQVGRNLDLCHDNLVQPQKRKLARTMLDLVLCRVVEIKHELVAMDFSDIQHCDEAMEDMRLFPQQLEVPLPTYLRRERLAILEKRSQLMEETLKKAGLPVTTGDEPIIYTFLEALQILQKHERARQGRAKVIQKKQYLARQEHERTRKRYHLSREEAVLLIQSHARGTLARKRVKKMREEEELFLGLHPDPSAGEVDVNDILRKAQEEKYDLQKVRLVEEHETRERLQARITYEEGPALMTDIENSIQEWIFQEKNETGKFPELPDEDEGGSEMILGRAGHFVFASTLDTSEKKGGQKEDSKQKKKDVEEPRLSSKSSVLVAEMKKACEEYKDTWAWRTGEGEDCEERVIDTLLEGEIRSTVEEEIRKNVDNYMRHEIQRLKEEVEGEKRGSKKKKRGKKGKGKKRKEKDLTPDRTTESLYQELVLNGIIKRVPEVSFKDLPGIINVAGSSVLETTQYAHPTLTDIKNVLTEYVALPLGVERIRTSTPLVKSLLLCGPKKSGKSTLINALCHDIGATLFDLTPSNIVGRYPGKAGLNMLTHLVLKIGRLMQPSIVLVDEADKMFMKKVPKTDKSDPKRLRKELPKIVKNITSEERIIVIGLSNSPWNCDVKSLSSVYQKILLVYRPTFSARCFLWRNLITKAGGQITSSFDLASLARISDGYATGHIEEAVQKVFGDGRKLELGSLTVEEFVQPLSKTEPIYKEEEEAFKAFYFKTPLMKKRARLLEEEYEAALAKAKAESKGVEQAPQDKKKKKKKAKKKA